MRYIEMCGRSEYLGRRYLSLGGIARLVSKGEQPFLEEKGLRETPEMNMGVSLGQGSGRF